MRTLILGGSGLFGKKTVSALLRDPDFERVISMDVAPPPKWHLDAIGPYTDRFEFVCGDVSDLESILAAASENRVDQIVNLAMIMAKAANPRANTKVALLGMCNVFEAARLLGIRRVVYASSETVYGQQEDYGDREVSEDDRLMPATWNFYALAKTLSELVAAQYQELYGIESTALRPTMGFGHGGKDPEFVRWFSEIVSLPAVGKPVALEVTGQALFSIVASDDVAEFTRRALRTTSSPHTAYNLGSPPHSLRDVAQVVTKLIPDARISFGDQPGWCELPWKVNCDRAKVDYDFRVMPLDEAVLLHANDARADAGLPPLSP